MFIKDASGKSGKFCKISKQDKEMKIKDETLTPRQIAVLEQTLGRKRVLLSGALGSGKTLICILKMIAAIEADPLKTKILFWIVSTGVAR